MQLVYLSTRTREGQPSYTGFEWTSPLGVWYVHKGTEAAGDPWSQVARDILVPGDLLGVWRKQTSVCQARVRQFSWWESISGFMTIFNPSKKLHREKECHPGSEIHSTLGQVNYTGTDELRPQRIKWLKLKIKAISICFKKCKKPYSTLHCGSCFCFPVTQIAGL